MDANPNIHARVVLHVDMDAFFASIEQRDNPVLLGKPVIVGGDPTSRGVVSAASYEARRFGVHSAMPTREAYKRCPHGAFIKPRMKVYQAESEHLMQILQTFSPSIEPISVDEAFVDLTGSARLLGSPVEVAKAIAHAITAQMHLTASIGIAPNKFLAKIASDCNKPNGITLVPFTQKEIIAWLAPLPIGRIWGVGDVTEKKLRITGIQTIGDLQHATDLFLEQKFGSSAQRFRSLSCGIDARPLNEPHARGSISKEHTFSTDCANVNELRKTLLMCATAVAAEARAKNLAGRTVVFTYRLSNFTRHSRRCTLSSAALTANQIYQIGCELLEKHIRPGTLIRLAGLGISNLESLIQQDLFNAAPQRAWAKSEKASDALAAKFGKKLIHRGTEIAHPPRSMHD